MKVPVETMDYTILLLIPGLLIGLSLYFLPSIIAGIKKHPNKNSILVLNIILGFTGIGWLVLCVWALIDNKQIIKNESTV